METNRISNNQVTISGEIVSDFEFSHEVYGEKFYMTKLASKRNSGAEDIIPIIVSDRLINIEKWKGKLAEVSGQFRSYNKKYEDKAKLILFVFANEFKQIEEIPFLEDENKILLEGFLCKNPKYRKTPLGREIADILIAVNRPYRKSDYIPCIAWGRNAKFASGLEIGSKLQIEGRIQSREYQKKISDDECETRIAYEVSIRDMREMENEQNED